MTTIPPLTSILVDGTTIRIDAGLDIATITSAFRHHKAEWIKNGNSSRGTAVAVLNVRNLSILPDGIHAGLTYVSTREIDVIAAHQYYPGVPLPYLYHELGHLESNSIEHTDSRWPRWENEQVISNQEWVRKSRVP